MKTSAPFGMSRTREQALALIEQNSEVVPAPYGLDKPCRLWKGGKTKGYGKLRAENAEHYVHRYVVDAPFNTIARHRCDRPSCCEPSHIVLGSQADNVADKVERGRQCRGTTHYKATVTPEKVKSIRASHAARIPLKTNASAHGVGLSCVKAIVYGKTWTHV